MERKRTCISIRCQLRPYTEGLAWYGLDWL